MTTDPPLAARRSAPCPGSPPTALIGRRAPSRTISSISTGWRTAFHTAYLVGSIAGITIGAGMMRSATFGKPTAYLGILSNAVGLGPYLPVVGVYVSAFAVLLLEVWYVLLARGMLRLARGVGV